MSKRAKREIRYSIRNIIEVVIFLVVTTWFWYGPRIQMQKHSEMIRKTYAYMNGVDIENDNEIEINEKYSSGEYRFTIHNNTTEDKQILVTLVLNHNKIKEDHCETLSYNKIEYHLMEEGENDETLRTLSMSGDILVTTLKPQEERKYILKYFVDDNISLEGNHFHSYAILSSGQNL